jgi:dTDP-4-dehydrorhamnose reductase
MRANAVELVVGADGMIGGALLRRLRSLGRPALGTSRRHELPGQVRHLDLAQPPATWDGPPVSVAYLCAAVARLDACRRDPEGSARVNVEGTCRLAAALAATGAFVVYLSTNQVFDGTVPNRRPEEAPCPQSEYGRQKAAAEQQIARLGTAAVLRLTKVFGESVPLFAGWAAALRRGERIRPYADMWMAPLPVSCVTTVLQRLGRLGRPGIYHLSGGRDVTYAEAARLAVQLLDADEALIEPVVTRETDPSAEAPPRHTTLDMAGLPQRVGLALPDVYATIRAALATETASGRNAA